ncbi:MAG: discoidin domain-containing protein [Bacteroidales bacterium]|nr:discoidin domain-containing protein [Bacteroidales bacterium]
MKNMKTKAITAFLSIFFGLLSCKNDGGIPEVALPDFMHVSLLGTQNNPLVKKFNPGSGDTVFVISATYGGTNNFSQGDMEVVLAVDPSLVAAFNAENGTAYLLLPADAYELEETAVRIADGDNTGNLNLIVKIRNINPSADYLLPVSIVSVSGKIPLNEDRKTLYLLLRPDYDSYAGKEAWIGAGYSSDGGSAHSAGMAYDGDEDTYWQSAPGLGLPQWFVVDMKTFKRIDGFTLGIPGGVNALPKHIRIETSHNRTDWQTVLDIPELGQTPGMEPFSLEQYVVARYFKVTVESVWNSATFACLAEVGVYSLEQGPEVTTKMEKDTWTGECSSEWQANHNTGPLKVLDDNNRTMWHASPTAGDNQPWLLFDMQKVRKISGFKIWNRQDDHGREPKHILFELSSDGVNWETLLDVPNMSNSYTAEIDLPAPEPKTGRYLKITILGIHPDGNPGYSYLAEVAPY